MVIDRRPELGSCDPHVKGQELGGEKEGHQQNGISSAMSKEMGTLRQPMTL